MSDDDPRDFLPFMEEYSWQKPNRPRQMRTQRMMPPEAYVRQSDGFILTAWGEILPSVEDSKRHLKELLFRFQNPQGERQRIAFMLLKIVEIDPLKGCWTIDKRLHVITGYTPIHVPGEGHPLDFHRLMYAVSRGELREGREWHLDHKCMNKPCGMPLHLEYESREDNTRKGQKAHEVVNLIEMGQRDLFDQ